MSTQIPNSKPPAKFRPLLAATIENDEVIQQLAYPLIASPKVDGIRVLIHPELGPVTRSLKSVKNTWVREALSRPEYKWLDGEIVCGAITARDVFQKTTTGVMTHSGEPDFTYYVFDNFQRPQEQYQFRHQALRLMFAPLLRHAKILPAQQVQNPDDVSKYECLCLEEGYEGIMLRSAFAPYKFNRSTLREQTLLKLKRFLDDEATVYGFEPLRSNQNPQTRDNRGYAERSDHKAGKVELETLGSLLVRHPDFGEFAIGSGFTQEQRSEIWQRRNYYLRKTVTFKYQPTGIKDKPRFPIFIRFRWAE